MPKSDTLFRPATKPHSNDEESDEEEESDEIIDNPSLNE